MENVAGRPKTGHSSVMTIWIGLAGHHFGQSCESDLQLKSFHSAISRRNSTLPTINNAGVGHDVLQNVCLHVSLTAIHRPALRLWPLALRKHHVGLHVR